MDGACFTWGGGGGVVVVGGVVGIRRGGGEFIFKTLRSDSIGKEVFFLQSPEGEQVLSIRFISRGVCGKKTGAASTLRPRLRSGEGKREEKKVLEKDSYFQKPQDEGLTGVNTNNGDYLSGERNGVSKAGISNRVFYCIRKLGQKELSSPTGKNGGPRRAFWGKGGSSPPGNSLRPFEFMDSAINPQRA